MPQHTSRSKKHPRDKRDKEVPVREDGQCFAVVTKMLGNARLAARVAGLDDECICKIRKRLAWITVGDILLVSQRPFEPSKGDVLHKYTPEDTVRLRRIGELDGLPTPGDDDDDAGLVDFCDDVDVNTI